MRNRTLGVLILLGLGIPGGGAQAQTPNFYTDAAPPTKKTPAPNPKKSAPASKPTPAPPPRPTPRPTPRPAATPRPTQPKSAPAAQPTPRPRPVPRGLDPYGLSAVFTERWDFLHFITPPAEALRYRIESARLRASRMARTVARLEQSLERREKNIRNSALAAFLLGQANTDFAGDGTQLPLLAVQSTLRRDVQERERELAVYEILRSAENAAVERLRSLEKKPVQETDVFRGLEGVERDPAVVTVSVAEEARRQTEALVHERALDTQTELALQTAEALSAVRWKRETLASLAPALPDIPPEPGTDPLADDGPPRPVRATRPRPAGNGDEPAPPPDFSIVIRTGPERLVRAAADGTVVFAGPFRGVGHLVVIEHPGGLFSIYEDLDGVRVDNGQAVRKGQTIGQATGAPDSTEGWLRFHVRRGVDVVPPGELLGQTEAATVVAR